jgi:molybdenum cofactor guanylyltransferase
MGGQDKGLLPLGRQPAVAWLLQSLAPQTDALLISANRHLERYREFGYPVIEDTAWPYAGPLAGLLAGLEQCRTDYLLSVPCDAPLLEPDYAARMLAALRATAGARLCVAHDGERLQPVHLLLQRDLAGELHRYLASGQRRALDWIDGLPAAVADFSDRPEQFWNMNTPLEHEQLQARLVGSP